MPYQRNIRKGIKSIPPVPAYKPSGPFRTEQDGQHSNIIYDVNGLAVLRVRSGVDSRRMAEWVAKTLSAAHFVQENSDRTKAVFEGGYSQPGKTKEKKS